MKRSEEYPLLNDLLTGPEVAEFREASLREALTILQRRRRRRTVLRGAALVLLPVVVLVVLSRIFDASTPKPAVEDRTVIVSAPTKVKPSSIEFISDGDLLALFPDEPLALVGPKGNQQLVFLVQAFSDKQRGGR